MSFYDYLTERPTPYSHWVTMFTKNSGTVDIRLQALYLTDGKRSTGDTFAGDKGKEFSTTQFNGYILHPGDEVQINACGREDSASGTTGWFDLIDCTNERRIRQFHWDCPWGSSTNTWTITDPNETWMVETKGANFVDGALGSIFIECLNKATH